MAGTCLRPQSDLPTNVLSVPLTFSDNVIGVLTVLGPREYPFTEEEIGLVQLFAQQAAIAVHNAQLLTTAQEQRRLAEALRDAGNALSATVIMDEVLDQLLKQIGRVVPYDTAVVMFVQEGRARSARSTGFNRYGPDVVSAVRDLDFDISNTPNLRQMMRRGAPCSFPRSKNMWAG